MFGYYLIAEVLEKQNNLSIFRKDTLNLDEIFKEAKVYFNHIKFTIENDTFNIYLVQNESRVSNLMRKL